MLNRRTFLGATAATAVTTTLGRSLAYAATPNTLNITLANRTGSNNVFAYVTGLDLSAGNAWMFLQADGRSIYHPASPDIGCGAGVPCTRLLAEHGDVLGLDISNSQIELARKNVPNARFIKADMTTVELPPAGFDAVTAFYSIAHIPRSQHSTLFRRIATWLRPGGHFLAALGSGNSHGIVENWLGAPMFFSSYDAPTNRRLLGETGLIVSVDETVTMYEPEGPATFQWVIATKPDHETHR